MTPLYVIADRDVFDSHEEWLDFLARLAPMGIDLQVRAKRNTPKERAAAVARVRDAGGRPLLNGATREALELGADGVHWPEALIPERRERDADRLRIGASVHSLAAVRRAVDAGAEFLVFGPVFDPGSKPGQGVGLEALAQIARATSRPVLAVGGVTPDRVAACRASGALGVAVVSGVLRAPDPERAIESYLAAWSAAQTEVSPCR
jgi:thiamine-phosphate pyrophosphorylase